MIDAPEKCHIGMFICQTDIFFYTDSEASTQTGSAVMIITDKTAGRPFKIRGLPAAELVQSRRLMNGFFLKLCFNGILFLVLICAAALTIFAR